MPIELLAWSANRSRAVGDQINAQNVKKQRQTTQNQNSPNNRKRHPATWVKQWNYASEHATSQDLSVHLHNDIVIFRKSALDIPVIDKEREVGSPTCWWRTQPRVWPPAKDHRQPAKPNKGAIPCQDQSGKVQHSRLPLPKIYSWTPIASSESDKRCSSKDALRVMPEVPPKAAYPCNHRHT